MGISAKGRVLISRLESQNYWSVISNPKSGLVETAMDKVLYNFANEYVEYKNCGVLHRMVRFEDLPSYGIDPDSVLLEWVLQFKEVGEKVIEEPEKQHTTSQGQN